MLKVSISFLRNWFQNTELLTPILKQVLIISILFFSYNFSYCQYDDGKNNVTVNGGTSTSQTIVGRQSITIEANVTMQQGFLAYIEHDLYYEPEPSRVVDGQSQNGADKNFIFTRTLRIPITDINTFENGAISLNKQVIEQITYFDGLSRPIQTIGKMSSAANLDIINPIEYDNHGRETKKYLPYSYNGDGSYRSNALLPGTEQSNFYSNGLNGLDHSDTRPYAEITFDNSPLNRVVADQAPGTDLNGTQPKKVLHTIGPNAANSVTLWKIDGSGYCTKSSYYNAGELYVTTITDENGNNTKEYKDKVGHVVLKESEESTGNYVKTCYVYDDFGLLRYVLPPEMQNQVPGGITQVTLTPTTTSVLNYCYYYNYDKRQRMTEKKLPGARTVYMVYDKRGRIVLSQDGNQRNDRSGTDVKKWTYTKYDELNRPIITGIYAHGTALTQSAMQNYIDGLSYQIYETQTSANYSTQHGYTNLAFPNITVNEIYSVNYYDSYDFNYDNTEEKSFVNDGIATTEWTQSKKGLLTGQKFKILGTSNFKENVNFYDGYGRIIQLQKTQPGLGTYSAIERISKGYNLAGELLKTIYKQIVGSEIHSLIDDYTYDNGGRLIELNKKIDSEDSKTIFKNTYNELGKIVTEKIGVTATNALQTIDYLYNIRGWLKGINDVFNSSENDLFSEKINYYDFLNDLNNNQQQYNGNICSIKWINKQMSNWGAYGFYYDKLNRIKQSEYGEYTTAGVFQGVESDKYDENNITYDLNGNIITLNRRGNTLPGIGAIDQLDYTYDGNQLKKVHDAISPIYERGDFSDRVDNPTEYYYDWNGNMYKDDNKGITDITYNYLNLPEKITFNASNYIQYSYDASGSKVQKKVYKAGILNLTEYYAGATTYTIPGSTTFSPATHLNYIIAENGRLVKSGSSFKYEFFLKDHLGNTRVVFTDANSNGMIENNTSEILQYADYYPFGLLQNHATTLNDDNRRLYNGKDLQSDAFDLDITGTFETLFDWYDYGARFYDPQIGRFHSVDNYSEKNYSRSNYLYSLDNPFNFVDINGDSAWSIKKQWNSRYIAKYQNSVQNTIKQYQKQGKTFTCDDLALSVLIDFAAKYGLPVSITNGTGTYDARSEKYTDAETFKEDVLKTTGAPDLQNDENTSTIDVSNAKAGDIILNRYENGKAHHTQLVETTANSIGVIGISQGNSGVLNKIPGASRFFGAGNPNSIAYTGKPIEGAIYIPAADFYKNFTTGTMIPHYSEQKNIEFKRWNFSNF